MKNFLSRTPSVLFLIVFILFMAHFQMFGSSHKSQMRESQIIKVRYARYNPVEREMVYIWARYFTDQYYFDIFFAFFVIGMIFAHNKAKHELEELNLLSTPSNIVYRDKSASGHSLDNLGDRLGGARNCLDVIVTPEELITQLSFPFRFFDAGSQGKLLNRIKLSDIIGIDNTNRSKIIISFHDDAGGEHRLEVKVKNPSEFLKSLGTDL